MDDVYSNQKQLSAVVADYFFVCPTNLFANIVSSRGARVYYYFFTHVSHLRYFFTDNVITIIYRKNTHKDCAWFTAEQRSTKIKHCGRIQMADSSIFRVILFDPLIVKSVRTGHARSQNSWSVQSLRIIK